MEWLTKITVVPPLIKFFHSGLALFLECIVAYRGTSSAIKISGFVVVAMANAILATIPEE